MKLKANSFVALMIGGLKTLRLPDLLAWLLISTQVINAQESAKFEKIRDVSPDKKFAVRISPNGDPGRYQQVELVSLPSKKVVLRLPQNYDGAASNVIWSADSKWFAFPLSDGPRVTYTHVYHRSGDEISEFKTDNLQVDAKGDVRNEMSTQVGG